MRLNYKLGGRKKKMRENFHKRSFSGFLRWASLRGAKRPKGRKDSKGIFTSRKKKREVLASSALGEDAREMAKREGGELDKKSTIGA